VTMESTNLLSLAQQMSELPRSKMLLKEPGLRLLLLHLQMGESLAEHKVEPPITIQCLRGDAVLVWGSERADLPEGALISLAGGIPHSVESRAESLILVTICG
jgi:quercetin dioxygenase-like cupin family protein